MVFSCQCLFAQVERASKYLWTKFFETCSLSFNENLLSTSNKERFFGAILPQQIALSVRPSVHPCVCLHITLHFS